MEKSFPADEGDDAYAFVCYSHAGGAGEDAELIAFALPESD